MTRVQSKTSSNPLLMFRSIFFKCVVMLVASSIVLAATLSYKSLQATNTLARDSILVFGDEILMHLSNRIAAPLQSGNFDDVSATMAETIATMNQNAAGVMVLAADGTVVSEEMRDNNSSASMLDVAQNALASGQVTTNADRLIIAYPIHFGPNKDIVGVVASDWQTEVLAATVAQGKKTALIISVLLGLVMILLTAIVMHTILTKPMSKLAAATKKMSSGDFDVDIQTFKDGNELSSLAKALNSFRTQLAGSEAASKDATMKSTALDAGSAAIMIADADFKIVYASSSVLDLLKQHRKVISARIPTFDPENIIGQTIDIFHKKPDMQRDMLNGLGADGHDASLEMDDITLELRISRIDDDAGARIGYVVEWADVSEQRLNAAVLKSLNENQVRAEFGADGQLVDANDAFLTLFGLQSPSEPCTFSQAVFIDHTPANPAKAMFGELTIKGNNGSVSHLLGGLSPVNYVNGALKRTVLIAADVTEEFLEKTAATNDRQRLQAEQETMITSLSGSLSKLADGDLTVRIQEEFSGSNDQIRLNFNTALERLEEAIDSVVASSEEIKSEVGGVASSAVELSRRTESQAATLEETAAAVTEISASISSSADGAKSTNEVVKEAQNDAKASGEVVHRAVNAMAEISKSSSEIKSIVKVIDDIAFQTNLLALNAGVEAARAGDAGLGFAVVASEVRALAARSSEAASEIGSLIAASTESVELGSQLVGDAGTALEQIIESISDISEYVSQIAKGSQEQSSSVVEINSAMTQLDQVTQQNAAMFEETTAASQNLTRFADDLTTRVGRFSTRSTEPSASWTVEDDAEEDIVESRSA